MRTLEMERDVMELPLVSGVLCRGAIADGGLALWRQREERVRAEVEQAMAVIKAWDWYEVDVADMVEWIEDHWEKPMDSEDAQDAADEISEQISRDDVTGRMSVDYARLGWALDAYAEALRNLARAEKAEADRLGLVAVLRGW